MKTTIKLGCFDIYWGDFLQYSEDQNYFQHMRVVSTVLVELGSKNYPKVHVPGKELLVTLEITDIKAFLKGVLEYYYNQGLTADIPQDILKSLGNDLVDTWNQSPVEHLLEWGAMDNLTHAALLIGKKLELGKDKIPVGIKNALDDIKRIFTGIMNSEALLSIEEYRNDDVPYGIDLDLFYEDLLAWDSFEPDPNAPKKRWVAGGHTTEQVIEKLAELVTGDYPYFHPSLIDPQRKGLKGNLMVGIDGLLELALLGSPDPRLPLWGLQIKDIVNYDRYPGEPMGELYTVITIGFHGNLSQGDKKLRIEWLKSDINRFIERAKIYGPSESIFNSIVHINSYQGSYSSLSILVKYN